MRIIDLAIIGILAARPPAAHAETKTVSWFKAHPDVRAQVNKLCMDNPGEAHRTPDCINAEQAGEQAAADRILRTPRPPSLIDQCASMGTLFQTIYHCGSAGAVKR